VYFCTCWLSSCLAVFFSRLFGTVDMQEEHACSAVHNCLQSVCMLYTGVRPALSQANWARMDRLSTGPRSTVVSPILVAVCLSPAHILDLVLVWRWTSCRLIMDLQVTPYDSSLGSSKYLGTANRQLSEYGRLIK
jgi:hypothetical protein